MRLVSPGCPPPCLSLSVSLSLQEQLMDGGEYGPIPPPIIYAFLKMKNAARPYENGCLSAALYGFVGNIFGCLHSHFLMEYLFLSSQLVY